MVWSQASRVTSGVAAIGPITPALFTAISSPPELAPVTIATLPSSAILELFTCDSPVCFGVAMCRVRRRYPPDTRHGARREAGKASIVIRSANGNRVARLRLYSQGAPRRNAVNNGANWEKQEQSMSGDIHPLNDM